MAQQTAVEWLINWSKENPVAFQSDYYEAIEQAKAMEEAQIMNAWYACKLSIIDKSPMDAKEYFNQTYKK
jgi:hypothetical protein